MITVPISLSKANLFIGDREAKIIMTPEAARQFAAELIAAADAAPGGTAG